MSLVVSGEKVLRARVRVPSLADPSADAYFYENTTVNCMSPPCSVSLGTWPTASSGPGTYSVFWEAENDKGCISTLTTTFTVTANLACQITPTNPNLSPTQGKASDQNTKLSWDIVNNSGKDLTITRLEVSWTSVLGEHRLLNIEYPDGSIVTNFASGSASPALADYSLFPLLFPVNSSSNCSQQHCIRMAVQWDTQIVNKFNVGETVTVRYVIQDASGSTGSCSFSIKPDLTIP
jgi:hypothetical protein